MGQNRSVKLLVGYFGENPEPTKELPTIPRVSKFNPTLELTGPRKISLGTIFPGIIGRPNFPEPRGKNFPNQGQGQGNFFPFSFWTKIPGYYSRFPGKGAKVLTFPFGGNLGPNFFSGPFLTPITKTMGWIFTGATGKLPGELTLSAPVQWLPETW